MLKIIVKKFPKWDYISKEDNAPMHQLKRTYLCKNENCTPCMTLPSQSPDI